MPIYINKYEFSRSETHRDILLRILYLLMTERKKVCERDCLNTDHT